MPAVEEVTPYDVEVAYGCLGVGMEHPEELLRRVQQRHGHAPLCVVGVGRKGF